MKLSFGLYTKSLVFWLTVVTVFAGTVFTVRSRQTQRVTAFNTPTELHLGDQFEATVEISRNGRVVYYPKGVLGQGRDVSSALSSRRQLDEFRLKVLDESNLSFSRVTIDVVVPFSVDEPSLNPSAILIHSIDPQVAITKIPPSTVRFAANEVSPDAVFTIKLEFKRGLIAYPLGKRMVNFLVNAPLGMWIALALILPGSTLIYMVYLLLSNYRGRIGKPTAATNRMPRQLPPAVVGLLKRGYVSGRDIAATLVDLARRGYLEIFWRDGSFSFGKRKNFHFYSSQEITALPPEGPAKTVGLQRFEEVLLSKILPPEGLAATEDDLVVRVGHRLFSRKIAEVYAEIYQLGTREGFFVENPATVHRRIRRRGIALFVAGLIGFVISGVYVPEPKFLLIFWIGMIGASLLIVELGNFVPLRTPAGERALQDWLAFERYLTDPAEISYSETVAGVFERYLPYAIALGVEGAWTYRFRRHPFVAPGWFGSTTLNLTLEQFDRQLFPLLSWVATALAASREPTVE